MYKNEILHLDKYFQDPLKTSGTWFLHWFYISINFSIFYWFLLEQNYLWYNATDRGNCVITQILFLN